MKYFCYCFLLLSCMSCFSNEDTSGQIPVIIDNLASKDTVTTSVHIPKEQIEAKNISNEIITAFLDSLDALSFEEMESPSHYADSLLEAKVQNLSSKIISDKDLEMLKIDSSITQKQLTQLIDLKRLSSESIFDYYSENVKDSILLYKFKKLGNQSKNTPLYAWYLNSTSLRWENDFFLIKKYKGNYHLIGPILNFHRYGEIIQSFQTASGKTIICFRENFGSGSGIFQFNNFYYYLDDLTLKPVLNLISESGLYWPTRRNFHLDYKTTSTVPLQLNLNYFNELVIFENGTTCDSVSSTIRYPLVTNSINLSILWDNVAEKYTPIFTDKLSQHQLNSYYLDSEITYFIKSHLSIFRKKLTSKERCIIKVFLQEAIAEEYNYKID